MQTGAHQLLLGGLYLATAHLLDERPWSGNSVLATIYAAMALPHLILGAIALPLGIGLRTPGAEPDREVRASRRPAAPMPALSLGPGGAVVGVVGSW